MKHKYNKLILGKKYIEYIFSTNLSKYKLPIWHLEYQNFTCYLLSKSPRIYSTSFEYKIVFDYKVSNTVPCILLNIKKILTVHQSILQISNNGCENLINELSNTCCFDCIIFSKNFSTSKYIEIKNMIGVKYVIYKGLWNENIINLPNNLEILVLNVKKNIVKLFNIPEGTRKIIFNKCKKEQHIINLEDMKGEIKKILYVDKHNLFNMRNSLNLHELEYECLVCLKNNNCIDFTNLPTCIKLLYLQNFDDTLDYLPSSIEKIIFNFQCYSDMLNLPPSIKTIHLNNVCLIKDLPDFVEILYIDFFRGDVAQDMTSIKFPQKTKIINVIYENDNMLKKFINLLNIKIPNLKLKYIKNPVKNILHDIEYWNI